MTSMMVPNMFLGYLEQLFFKTLLKKALFGNCGKILLSGTYPSSKDPGGKKMFRLQISKI